MKVYQVVYEQDGETITELGKRATTIDRMTLRYAAEHIIEVWDAIEWLLIDEEKTIIAIIEESPAITVLESNNQGKGLTATDRKQGDEA